MQHNCSELCEAGVSYGNVNYVYVEAEIKRERDSVCVRVCGCTFGRTRSINQTFLGTLISISNHSLEHCLKGRLLINSMVKSPLPDARTENPSLLHLYCCSSFFDLHTAISSRTKSGWFESDGLLQEGNSFSGVFLFSLFPAKGR